VIAVTPWYQTAVFYELPVFAFRDSNGDGVGDFAGLTDKLDYLEWLGVDCIWILPVYESPLRDGGYDISDFRAVQERYGSVDDVRRFLSKAHLRGMRVITDLVVNHTSDQHPWFEEARQPGSATRDRYVWTDDPTQWSEARVIFTDTHDSNWTWDEVAGAYYWHRFFDHQPDLNFDHPDVGPEILDVVRFWLDLGFDGLRLDAVPYLFERDGTNGENLPETHAWLRLLRQTIDAEYQDRVLLAEANQWPEDVVAYFGDGDECHMAFHFPVMPRLFMALKRGDATSITDILAQTPPIPAGAQWGVFLRNHDELTLEMVTPEERNYMYAEYAPDPAMRKNLGIRRRLAPLLEGDRRRMELLHAVLLSLPGSPVLYYGDEIGMGDIYTLKDRDGVRTPMQWNGSANGGFSTAAPADLYLPLVTEDGYAPDDRNVADQQRDPESLLNWIRGHLAIRAEHPVMGTGRYQPVAVESPAVLSYLRTDAGEHVLVVANFSDTSVITDIDLPPGEWISIAGSGCQLAPGRLVLDGYGYAWFERA